MKSNEIEDQVPSRGEPAKRPYSKPELRVLGDVRELTRGSGARTAEGFGKRL